MSEDSTVIRFPQPEVVDDPLTAVLRTGARRLLAQAIEAEAEDFLAGMAERRLADGRVRFVRHGHGPERTVQTGIGPVEVRRAKVRDRAPAESGNRVRLTSRILPRWARRRSRPSTWWKFDRRLRWPSVRRPGVGSGPARPRPPAV